MGFRVRYPSNKGEERKFRKKRGHGHGKWVRGARVSGQGKGKGPRQTVRCCSSMGGVLYAFIRGLTSSVGDVLRWRILTT